MISTRGRIPVDGRRVPGTNNVAAQAMSRTRVRGPRAPADLFVPAVTTDGRSDTVTRAEYYAAAGAS